MITVGSLFTGIGGIELGLERTGGFRVIWNCEINRYASQVLRKHWPNVPNLGDIREVDWSEVEKPIMLTGGFPCQDISIVGKKKGIQKDTRSGLWFEYFRAISLLRPRIALIENVPEIVNNGLDIVLSDLASVGYNAEWANIPASEVGAWHKRERIFIIAYPDNISIKGFIFDGKFKKIANAYRTLAEKLPSRESLLSKNFVCRKNDDVPFYVDRIKCLGNAVVPQVAEVVGEIIVRKFGYESLTKL